VFSILLGEEASDDELLRFISGCTGDTEPKPSTTAAEPTSAAAPMVGANALAAVAVAVVAVVVAVERDGTDRSLCSSPYPKWCLCASAGLANSSRSWSVPTYWVDKITDN
jgi:hypothetical protein